LNSHPQSSRHKALERGAPLRQGRSLRRGGSISYCWRKEENKNKLSISDD
jgi:hypothetical protein